MDKSKNQGKLFNGVLKIKKYVNKSYSFLLAVFHKGNSIKNAVANLQFRKWHVKNVIRVVKGNLE